MGPGLSAEQPARAAGESACRPGSVHPLARAGGHPSGTAVAGSLVRSTRELRAGHPQSLAQAVRPKPQGPSDLAPGGVYQAAAVTCGAGGLLHHRFTLTLGPAGDRAKGGLLSVALSRGSPRVGVTDHLALWSPDLPHRVFTPARPPGRLARRGSSIGANQALRSFPAGKGEPCHSRSALRRSPRHTSRSRTGRRRQAGYGAAPPAGRASRAAARSLSA
jgi:hypothetical protein